MAPRSKATKSRDKPADETVIVALDESAPASTSTPAPVRSRTKKHHHRVEESDVGNENSVVSNSEQEPAPVVPPKAPSRRSKSSTKTTAAEEVSPAAAAVATPEDVSEIKAEFGRSPVKIEEASDVDLAPAKQAVDAISDSFGLSEQLSHGLSNPGGLARAAVYVVLAGAVSEATAVAGRFVLGRVFADWLASWAAPTVASWYPSAWATWQEFALTTAPPGTEFLVSGLAIRIAKQVLVWGSRSRTVSLAFLTYAPMVYLLSCFYNVPLPAALLSEGLNFAADLTPLLLHHGFHGHLDATRRFVSALRKDVGTFALTSLFAAVLYGFTLVQACRLFLPSTLVVHFANIATVVPARLAAAKTIQDAYAILYMEAPALMLSAVCGVAARTFLFGVGPPGSSSGNTTTYAKTVAVRTGSLLLTVGLSIFTQCYWGIPGVSAVGASRFSGIWATAILLVGTGLGLAGA